MDGVASEDVAYSLVDLGIMQHKDDAKIDLQDEEIAKKHHKRKPRWGPMERIPRPRRGQDDGYTMLQKAQELKQIKNLEKGNPKSFAFESNSNLLYKAQRVNINLGSDTIGANKVIENLKKKELLTCEQFTDDNPEVNLPSNLNLEELVTNFSPLNDVVQTPMKESDTLVNQSWALVVFTGKAQQNNQTVNNDMSLLEC